MLTRLKILNRIVNPHHARVLHIHKSLISGPLQVANWIWCLYLPGQQRIAPFFYFLLTKSARPSLPCPLQNPIMPVFLLKSIMHMSCCNTHEGPDGIYYRILRHLSSPSLSLLLSTFNNMNDRNLSFPLAWSPFRKPNLVTFLKTTAPIRPASCQCKLLERMVSIRLMCFRFRRGRSSADPLAYFEKQISSAFRWRRDSESAVFFDLEKAYTPRWDIYIDLKKAYTTWLHVYIDLKKPYTTWWHNHILQLSPQGKRRNMDVFIVSSLLPPVSDLLLLPPLSHNSKVSHKSVCSVPQYFS